MFATMPESGGGGLRQRLCVSWPRFPNITDRRRPRLSQLPDLPCPDQAAFDYRDTKPVFYGHYWRLGNLWKARIGPTARSASISAPSKAARSLRTGGSATRQSPSLTSSPTGVRTLRLGDSLEITGGLRSQHLSDSQKLRAVHIGESERATRTYFAGSTPSEPWPLHRGVAPESPHPRSVPHRLWLRSDTGGRS